MTRTRWLAAFMGLWLLFLCGQAAAEEEQENCGQMLAAATEEQTNCLMAEAQENCRQIAAEERGNCLQTVAEEQERCIRTMIENMMAEMAIEQKNCFREVAETWECDLKFRTCCRSPRPCCQLPQGEERERCWQTAAEEQQRCYQTAAEDKAKAEARWAKEVEEAMAEARAEARERRAGMSGYALRYHRSMGGSDVVSLKMDYLGMYYGKNFLTGFYEVWSEIGGSVPDALFHYSLGMKLGLGVGSRIFSFFIASGIMVDSYKSTKSKSRDDHVAPGAGVPLTFGVWLNPTYDIAVYAMAEPSWAFGAKDRATTPFSPFSFARELRLRGGVSYALGDSWHGLKLRLDYTFHQVNPHDWHIVTLGIGY